MRTAAALKHEFVDHPAPPQPRVQILLHYTKPAKIDLGWKSRPNPLSDIVARNSGPRTVQPLNPAAVRAFAEIKVAHEAAVSKANASLLAGMQHLLAEEKRIKEMAALQSRQDAATATKKVSLGIFAFCGFALAAYASSGLLIVHPFFASLIGAGALIFYVIGRLMQQADASK
jgi:hypothetical protein